MNSLQHHASTRTKEDIEKISHVYLDIDHGGTASLEALENSDLVPRPNYVLNTSPEKFQVVWKVERMIRCGPAHRNLLRTFCLKIREGAIRVSNPLQQGRRRIP
jgi:RepB DNA-primase from phage plasmid